MIRKIIKHINLREYFPSPLWCFPLGNRNCNDDCLACLDYPTASHFSTLNWWSENEYCCFYQGNLKSKNDKAVKIMRKWKTIEGNKRLRVRVRFIFFYSELAPSDPPWCNMLQTSLGRIKYEEAISDEHPMDERKFW